MPKAKDSTNLTPARWEVRKGSWHPDSPEYQRWMRADNFSVTVNLVGSRAAAPFRVTGPTSSPRSVDAQAEALVNWINGLGPEADDCGKWIGPAVIEGLARIIVTAAGKGMGFLPARKVRP